MGVSIHYRGKINDIGLVEKLCDEISDIAKTMGCSSTILDDDWSIEPNATLEAGGRIEGELGLKGIQITPHPESEPLALFFDRDGNLRSLMSMLMILDGTIPPEKSWISMKTQFAGADTHVWVIGFLKYLKKHYISDLEVSDESNYWDTGDRKELEEKIAFLDSKIKQLSATISSGSLGNLKGLSADEIASRIEQLLRSDKGLNS